MKPGAMGLLRNIQIKHTWTLLWRRVDPCASCDIQQRHSTATSQSRAAQRPQPAMPKPKSSEVQPSISPPAQKTRPDVRGLEGIKPLVSTVEETPKPIGTTVNGTIPSWVHGSFLRNGPGKFEFGENRYTHWFDGMALMHRFYIKDGEVTYCSQFLRSDSYVKNSEKNRIVVSEFGTLAMPDPCKNFFARFFSRFQIPSEWMIEGYSVNLQHFVRFIKVTGSIHYRLLCCCLISASDLLEELLSMLTSRKLVTRAALHLMLVPQLRHLSLGRCSGLVTSNLCAIIGVRCQALLSLDLSGAVSVSSSVLLELLWSLAGLRSLTLAGCLCDSRVLQTLPAQCPMLRHLDVSRCHHLSPVSLLFLSPSHPQSPGLPLLRSFLALDIGFGECEEDRRATAAFLLLSLSLLERVALEGLGEACALLREGDFLEVEDFISRTGMPDFRELWRERANGEDVAGMEKVEEESFSLSKATNGCLWIQDSGDEDEGESDGIEGVCHDLTGVMALENKDDNETQKAQQGNSLKDFSLALHLRHVQGVTFGTVAALGQLCPNLSVLTLDYTDEEEAVSGRLLARELARWSTSLRSVTLRFPGPFSEMAHGVASVGTSLTSLTLEGVRADGIDPFLRFLHSCPKLTTLTIHIEPPRMHQEEEEEDREEERDEDLQALPCLPLLTYLALNFTFDERQKRTPIRWRSLKGALWALLRGAPLLERVSLVAVPCPLDPVFHLVLDHPAIPMRGSQNPALQHLWDLNLAHTDVSMATLSRLVAMDIPLSTLDLSGCWAVTLHNVQRLGAKRRRQKLHITWI